MKKHGSDFGFYVGAFLFAFAAGLFVSGCAPLLVAGGAAGGYAVAESQHHK